MSNSYTEEDLAKNLEEQDYKYGFTSDFKSDTIPVGLNEDVIRLISSKKDKNNLLNDIRMLNSFQ